MEESNSQSVIVSRILAGTLHEIRTPIQTIVSTTELLEDTELDSEQKEYIRQIQFSAQILLNLANDILDFSKLDSSDLKLESIPVNLRELTEQVADTLSVSAYNKGVEIITDFAPDLPLRVNGDPVRLQQIIINFVKNAVKFTNKGYIHIYISYKDSKDVCIRITDTGIGVSDENKKKLFTDFFQGDVSTYRNYGGTGLGLSIVKKLVTIMGGKVGVEDNPEGGAVFWALIPLKKEEDFEKEESELSVPPHARFLIITACALLSQSIKTRLTDAGVKEADISFSEQDAMHKLVNESRNGRPYTAVFIDMNMGERDGWHIAQDIRQNPELNQMTKLYMMVNEGQLGKDTKMKMLNWVNGYLYKPIKNTKLYNLLRHMFDYKEDLEELEVIDDGEDREDCHTSGKTYSLKILVAEDHPVNRKLMETFVTRMGCKVISAENGRDAVSMIKDNPDTDLIFMDIQMPVMNGVEACSILRKNGYTGTIIACTANNDTDDAQDYMRIGMNDVLVKPFKKDSIQLLIDKWHGNNDVADKKEEPEIKSDVWDINDFADTTGGDRELMQDLALEYIKQTDTLTLDLNYNLSKKDYDVLKQLGHRLKGSSGAISAFELKNIAEKIENAACENNYEECNLQIKKFIYRYSQLKLIIENWRTE